MIVLHSADEQKLTKQEWTKAISLNNEIMKTIPCIHCHELGVFYFDGLLQQGVCQKCMNAGKWTIKNEKK